MCHGQCQILHGEAKYFADNVKFSTLPNIRRRLSNVPWRCYILHGKCEMFHGAAKDSTQRVK